MTLAKASWITVVVSCAIATIITAIAGYEGYSATIAAVGLAATVNLLPRRAPEPDRADEPDPPGASGAEPRRPTGSNPNRASGPGSG